MRKILITFLVLLMLVGCSDSNSVSEETKQTQTESETEKISEESTGKEQADSEETEVATETEETTESEELKPIIIGASPNVVEAVKAMENSLEDLGYELKVEAFDDIQLPNVALNEGFIDANLFQHKPFLDSYNEANGTDLVFVEPLFGGFTALYSEKWDSIEDIPQDAQIGIFQDASNQHRALLLGEKIGLFTLADKEEGDLYDLLDLEDNPRNIELIPLDSGGLTQGLEDLDACFNQGTTMYLAEKDPKDYLAVEEDNSEFAMGLVVSKENENEPWVEDIISAFRTDETKKIIDEYYKGSYVFFD